MLFHFRNQAKLDFQFFRLFTKNNFSIELRILALWLMIRANCHGHFITKLHFWNILIHWTKVLR